jgi:hypothetical protein
MKQFFISAGLATLLVTGFSCKNKDKNKTTDTSTTTTTTNTPATTPVEVSTDDALRKGVTDATKDFPGVNASVSDGVITLTGEIEKDRYPTLKQSLDALRPKQVINNLNYK